LIVLSLECAKLSAHLSASFGKNVRRAAGRRKLVKKKAADVKVGGLFL
jgi:hypothetical protein